MSTYLITGGAGFIGSHLADALLAAGHRVLVIDNLSTGSLDNIRHLLTMPNFRFARADIANKVVLDRFAFESDVILHMAAAVGVKLIVERPVHTIETNIMGTEYVLQAALRYQCRVLIASTSEVYGKGFKIPFVETDDVLLGPTHNSRWGYAASKMIDEFLGLAYHHEFGLPVILVRLFNTIGPRQTGHYGMVIPRLIQQAMAGKPLTVYGNGTQQRCFSDVADTVRAITQLSEHDDAPGRLFNIGNAQEEISIGELARRIIAITDSSSEIAYVPYAEAYAPGFEDMERRVPDTTRIRELIGWTPERSLDESLQRIHRYLLERDPAQR
jgi:UDP-glucose 4-epimerase